MPQSKQWQNVPLPAEVHDDRLTAASQCGKENLAASSRPLEHTIINGKANEPLSNASLYLSINGKTQENYSELNKSEDMDIIKIQSDLKIKNGLSLTIQNNKKVAEELLPGPQMIKDNTHTKYEGNLACNKLHVNLKSDDSDSDRDTINSLEDSGSVNYKSTLDNKPNEKELDDGTGTVSAETQTTEKPPHDAQHLGSDKLHPVSENPPRPCYSGHPELSLLLDESDESENELEEHTSGDYIRDIITKTCGPQNSASYSKVNEKPLEFIGNKSDTELGNQSKEYGNYQYNEFVDDQSDDFIDEQSDEFVNDQSDEFKDDQSDEFMDDQSEELFVDLSDESMDSQCDKPVPYKSQQPVHDLSDNLVTHHSSEAMSDQHHKPLDNQVDKLHLTSLAKSGASDSDCPLPGHRRKYITHKSQLLATEVTSLLKRQTRLPEKLRGADTFIYGNFKRTNKKNISLHDKRYRSGRPHVSALVRSTSLKSKRHLKMSARLWAAGAHPVNSATGEYLPRDSK